MGSKSAKVAQFVRKALLIACVALSLSCIVFGAFSYLFDKISVSGSQSWDQGQLNSGDVEGSTLRLVLTHGQMELRLLRWRAPPSPAHYASNPVRHGNCGGLPGSRDMTTVCSSAMSSALKRGSPRCSLESLQRSPSYVAHRGAVVVACVDSAPNAATT